MPSDWRGPRVEVPFVGKLATNDWREDVVGEGARSMYENMRQLRLRRTFSLLMFVRHV